LTAVNKQWGDFGVKLRARWGPKAETMSNAKQQVVVTEKCEQLSSFDGGWPPNPVLMLDVCREPGLHAPELSSYSTVGPSVSQPEVWLALRTDVLAHSVVKGCPLRAPRCLSKSSLPPWRLKRVFSFVEGHLAERLRLQDLACAAGLSRMHFAAQFKAATGCRPHSYLLRRRIERSQSLIREERMSLVQIALEVGFQSQAHFCTTFKRLTGQTPNRWRHNQDLNLGQDNRRLLAVA
jgi:AraC-like DNA-binding protein